MKTFTVQQLAGILDKHRKWLDSEDGGERANLSYTDLSYADLCEADLSYTNLSYTNLCGANLRGANLYEADLYEANLTRANLTRANLTRANLTGARMNWQSHDLIAAILRRATDNDPAKRMVAVLPLACRDWCWEEFEENCSSDPLWDWAIETLRQYVQDGDNAPDILREEVCDEDLHGRRTCGHFGQAPQVA